MPTYDYRCTACGREVEVVHGIHEQGPSTCGSCGGSMRKALSRPAIHFRGGGWAKKDAQAARSSKAAGSPGSGTSTSTEKGGDGASGSTEPAAKGSEGGTSGADAGGASGPGAGTASTTGTSR
jgi:putative FmdB family regulatory protein